jgi:hypothetical protein
VENMGLPYPAEVVGLLVDRTNFMEEALMQSPYARAALIGTMLAVPFLMGRGEAKRRERELKETIRRETRIR